MSDSIVNVVVIVVFIFALGYYSGWSRFRGVGKLKSLHSCFHTFVRYYPVRRNSFRLPCWKFLQSFTFRCFIFTVVSNIKKRIARRILPRNCAPMSDQACVMNWIWDIFRSTFRISRIAFNSFYAIRRSLSLGFPFWCLKRRSNFYNTSTDSSRQTYEIHNWPSELAACFGCSYSNNLGNFLAGEFSFVFFLSVQSKLRFPV